MLYGYMITENRSNDYKNITNLLGLFFEHIAKWRFIQDKQSQQWIKSLNKAIAGLEEHKKKNPASYKGYSINEHFDLINKDTIDRLRDNDNDLTRFNLNEIYSVFDTLDNIIDKSYVNQYLQKYANPAFKFTYLY